MTVFKEKLLEIYKELDKNEGFASDVIDNTQIWLIGLNLRELKDLRPQSNILSTEISNGVFKLDFNLAVAVEGFVYLIMKELLDRETGSIG